MFKTIIRNINHLTILQIKKKINFRLHFKSLILYGKRLENEKKKKYSTHFSHLIN